MAAIAVGSRRLPGMTQRNVLPIASVPGGGYKRPIKLPHLETFPGAACLTTRRAAGPQSGLPDVASQSFRRRGEVWLPSRPWVRSTRGVFANSVSFLILQALWRFWVTRARSVACASRAHSQGLRRRQVPELASSIDPGFVQSPDSWILAPDSFPCASARDFRCYFIAFNG
jgi:hypothetical protein